MSHLSPAYDMLPVNIILPEDKEEMALTLNGKKRKFKRADFMAFADKCEISEAAATKMIRKLCSLQERFMEECDQSYLSEAQKTQVKELIKSRIAILNA